ncbi:MAG TPA: transposase, partial [Bacteroidota bacterium]|nr:transposase [Bacteroidota bacterium]
MARRSIWFLPEHYYHIYNRGNNKEPIFLSDDNYHFFLRRLHHYYDQAAVQLIAYCLMPNHYHLLIYIHKEIDFSNVMRAFTISYTRSFNNWHRRVGHLFQSDFQARGIERDGYLPHLCRYIHLNPVKSMLVKNPED